MTNHKFDSRKTYVSSPVVTIFVLNRILFKKERKEGGKKAKLTQLLSLRWLSKIFSFKKLCTQHDSQP